MPQLRGDRDREGAPMSCDDIICDACGEVVSVDDTEQVCGWSICLACRTASGQVDQAASGFDYPCSLPPFWRDFGDHRGKN